MKSKEQLKRDTALVLRQLREKKSDLCKLIEEY